MPHIEAQDYNNLLAAKEHNNTLTEEINHIKDQKSKITILSIILGCLFLLTLGVFAYYMLSYTKGYVKIEASQQIVDSASIEAYKSKIISLEQAIKDSEAQNIIINQNSIKDQILYAVQIGAFKERDMSLYSSSLVNFKEISNSGYNKYALGNFETLPEAQDFRRELVTLGFNDAFIASFKNNKRLKIEETD